MKTKANKSRPSIAALERESREIETGKVAAARVTEIVLDDEGKLVSRRDLDPETERAEAARAFAIRSDVARVRHRANLTQQAFARRLRIPLSTLQKWERNAIQPSGAAATLLDLLDRRPDLIDELAEV